MFSLSISSSACECSPIVLVSCRKAIQHLLHVKLSVVCDRFQSGLMEMVTHEEALTILSRCIEPRDPVSMLEAVKLLAAICLVPPDGSVIYVFVRRLK